MEIYEAAALFIRHDSFYKTIKGCDCYDMERDARIFNAGYPVIAHPPCRAWGQMRNGAQPRVDEKELALFAIEKIQKNGGILEHPAKSTLWKEAHLPSPGTEDKKGGFSIIVNQHWWGHRAEKRTILYIVGTNIKLLPQIPFVMGESPCVVNSSKRKGDFRKRRRPEISRAERELTPPDFAKWLYEIAKNCAMKNL